MNPAEEKTKDPLFEITKYREEALNASITGNHALALCWKLAIDEAQNFSRQNTTNEILTPQQLPFENNITLLILSTQEAHYRLTYARNADSKKYLHHWMFADDESKKATFFYRYWIARSKAGSSKNFEKEIGQVTEAISKYHHASPETARLLREALKHFKFAQTGTPENEIATHRWKMAAYEATHAASIHLQAEAIAAAKNELLISLWTNIIHFSEQALALKIQAAEATQQGNEPMAIQCSLAAYSAGNAVTAKKKFLEIISSEKKEYPFSALDSKEARPFSEFPRSSEKGNLLTEKLASEVNGDKKDFILYWKEASDAAEQAAVIRVNALISNAYNNRKAAHLWKQALYHSENAFDYRMKAIALFRTQENSRWKEAAQAAEQAATLFAKAASSAKNKRNIFHFLLRKKAHRADQEAQKKIFKILMSSVSFCLPEPALPNLNQPLSPKSALYQTYLLLKQAGVACNFLDYIPSQGIAITLSSSFNPLFGVDVFFPPNIFLVDVVPTNHRPHLGAHLHLVQNRASTIDFFHALSLPPWPEAHPEDTRETTLQSWKELIEEKLPNLALQWQQKSASKRLWFLLTQRIAYFITAYLKNHD